MAYIFRGHTIHHGEEGTAFTENIEERETKKERKWGKTSDPV